eukprot:gene12335-biopygen14008
MTIAARTFRQGTPGIIADPSTPAVPGETPARPRQQWPGSKEARGLGPAGRRPRAGRGAASFSRTGHDAAGSAPPEPVAERRGGSLRGRDAEK